MQKVNGIAHTQTVKWLKIAIEVGVILFAIAIAWGTLRGRVSRNTEEIIKHDMLITAIDREQTAIKTDLRGITVSQEFTLKGIEEIKERLK